MGMSPPTRWPRGWVWSLSDGGLRDPRLRSEGGILPTGAVAAGGKAVGPWPRENPCRPPAPGSGVPAGHVRLKSLAVRCSSMAKPTPTAPPLPESYELALAELDQLVQRMEGGQLPLDQLLDSYRRGADLLNFCRGRLQAVEEQVKLLEDGQLKPWTAA